MNMDLQQAEQMQSAELNDSQIDSLLSDLDGGDGPTPVRDEAAAPTPSTPEPQTAQDFEFSWNGKQIKAPITDPRIKQWASQGYDYAQRMAAFKQQAAEFEAKQKSFTDIESRYKTIDDYVKENPDWWEHVQSSYEQKTQAIDPNNPFAKEIQSLKAELGEIKQFKQEFVSQKQAEQMKQEDQALDQEIKSIRDSYPDIDFNALDPESNQTLEAKVIKHGVENGFKSFKAAFRDFYHDELVKRAEMRGKESVAKDLQKRTKQGLLGTSQTPMKAISERKNIKNQSYEDITQEALAELGL